MSDLSQLRLPPRITEFPLAKDKEAFPQREKDLWLFRIDGEEFDFLDGKIYYIGNELAHVLKRNRRSQASPFSTTLTRYVATYRDWAQLNVTQPQHLGAFLALMQAYLSELYQRLKKRFDETL